MYPVNVCHVLILYPKAKDGATQVLLTATRDCGLINPELCLWIEGHDNGKPAYGGNLNCQPWYERLFSEHTRLQPNPLQSPVYITASDDSKMKEHTSRCIVEDSKVGHSITLWIDIGLRRDNAHSRHLHDSITTNKSSRTASQKPVSS